MAARTQPQDTTEEILRRIAERLRLLEDAGRRRMLPPGYEWSHAGGILKILRVSDGAEQVVAFDD